MKLREHYFSRKLIIIDTTLSKKSFFVKFIDNSPYVIPMTMGIHLPVIKPVYNMVLITGK